VLFVVVRSYYLTVASRRMLARDGENQVVDRLT
jgi:hypothetical protein